jgi:hypothetical protein
VLFVVCCKKNGSELRLKVQGNIEEQPMDVKGLVVLHELAYYLNLA